MGGFLFTYPDVVSVMDDQRSTSSRVSKSRRKGHKMSKQDESLAGLVKDGFRVKMATDMEMVDNAIAHARVTGSVGATERVCGPFSDEPIRFATVARIGTWYDNSEKETPCSIDVVGEIPGGWHGNNPGAFPNNPMAGNVVVDVKSIEKAIAWLKSRAKITGTDSHMDGKGCLGVLIKYEMNEKQ